ncbi:phosphotransferase family protein [Streptacidiphilus cavernicola]|uniref:Phosphotransferase family protein n=1 Tax=Streptacidiphilus cavernicola TaxID=3342716 RepID=A0ABV6W1F0_9ACTN
MLTVDQVGELVRPALAPSVRVTGAAELGGGGFAAVWKVLLDDGSAVVLKTSPPPDAELLGYERGLLAVEADYFARIARELPDLPVPEVLHHGTDRSRCDGDWMVMSLLPGTPLSELSAGPRDAGVRRQLGAALARVHALEGPEFGYPGEGRRRAATWRAAYLGIVDDLLADADRLGWTLPVPATEIARTVAAAADALEPVTRPALVHFDLWDGNVLAAPDASGAGSGSAAGTGTGAGVGSAAGALRLSGLVDGERCLYGDPLVDLVSPVLFGAIEDEPDHPLLRGYASATGGKPLDHAEVARIRLYRLWLYLVMNVEIPTRGMDAPAHAAGNTHRAELLRAAVAAVAAVRKG